MLPPCANFRYSLNLIPTGASQFTLALKYSHARNFSLLLFLALFLSKSPSLPLLFTAFTNTISSISPPLSASTFSSSTSSVVLYFSLSLLLDSLSRRLKLLSGLKWHILSSKCSPNPVTTIFFFFYVM